MPPLVAAAALVTLGLVIAGVRRAPPPPLTIARRADSPLTDSSTQAALRKSGELQTTKAALVEEQIYICGARTKKGTPCSRRVHGPVRCWQHKGMPAMMAQEKLLIKE